MYSKLFLKENWHVISELGGKFVEFISDRTIVLLCDYSQQITGRLFSKRYKPVIVSLTHPSFLYHNNRIHLYKKSEDHRCYFFDEHADPESRIRIGHTGGR